MGAGNSKPNTRSASNRLCFKTNTHSAISANRMHRAQSRFGLEFTWHATSHRQRRLLQQCFVPWTHRTSSKYSGESERNEMPSWHSTKADSKSGPTSNRKEDLSCTTPQCRSIVVRRSSLLNETWRSLERVRAESVSSGTTESSTYPLRPRTSRVLS